MFSEEAPGMPFYLSNGQFIRNQMESFLREAQLKHDYDEQKNTVNDEQTTLGRIRTLGPLS